MGHLPLFLVLVTTFAVTIAQQQQFGDLQGEEWQKQTREEKLNKMVNLQYDNLDTANFPQAPNESELLSYEYIVQPIFETASDDLPLFNPSGSGEAWQPVPKAAAQGVIASAVWTPTLNNPYTGCQDALIRLSLVSPPTSVGIVPGFAIKCLKDAHTSANILAQPTMSYPQNSYNLFLHDYTNHPVAIATENQTDTDKILTQLYMKTTKYPTMVGLSKFAEIDQNGKRESTPKFPFRIIFHPVDALHFAFPDSAPPSPHPWYYYLLLLRPGPIFEVYAQPEPEDQDRTEKYVHIGTISSTRKFIPGKFGDIHLSFEHTYLERDLEFYPNREGTTKQILQRQLGNSTYRHKDLPWTNTSTDGVLPTPDAPEPEEETSLEAVDIILIVFIGLAFFVLLAIIAVIIRGLYCYGSAMADYTELY